MNLSLSFLTDLVAALLSVGIVFAYHVFLRVRVRRDPGYTIHAVLNRSRRAWVERMMTDREGILGVQTLRNAIMVASFFAHDPDEKLDLFHRPLVSLDGKRNAVRRKLFTLGTQINGEIGKAKSQIEQVRALTNQRVALYRQANTRFRRLLPPSSFRKNPEFPQLEWWPEVSLNSEHEHRDGP